MCCAKTSTQHREKEAGNEAVNKQTSSVEGGGINNSLMQNNMPLLRVKINDWRLE